ncbi:MAG TPA: UDP-N-acetylglucosamine 1-carboxyvinyltransferase [Nitrospinae bacterium]|nr:UDP-N-acetylglucosamine 1-carboxyvinyltransferase [Nitrospinota bacterium]
MEKIIIEGGVKLNGTVKISGAKNAALPILLSSILTDKENKIHNVPNLKDVDTTCQLLKGAGVKVERSGDGQVIVDASRINNTEASYDLVRTMRASVMVLGPLLARLGKAKVSLPGGCAIGARPINLHLKGFEALGVNIKLEHGYVVAEAKRLKGNRIYFDIVTVTGTENIMMAGVLAEGKTIIENAAKEPEVVNLANTLNSMGASIKGAGTDIIEINGVSRLNGGEHTVIPDRIETGTFMVAAAITGGDVKITNCIPEYIEPVIVKLTEAGVNIDTWKDFIRVKANGKIKAVDIKTSPYPAFPTDMQAQFMSLMSISEGMSVITETVFENRFMHVAELRRMGANIKVEGNTAVIKGVPKLSAAPLMATDLRASASLILAGLAAEGETVISRVYHLDRGYEAIEKKLSVLGAKIRRVK